MKILFVCLGNICRSPIAEGILRKLAVENILRWEVDSAGTESFHIGEHPHQFSKKVCFEKGIDISMQRARRFTSADMDKFDKIYALSEDVYDELKEIAGSKFHPEKVDLLLNELSPGLNRSVKDPWYGNLDGYYEVFDEIEKCCKAIVEKYKI